MDSSAAIREKSPNPEFQGKVESGQKQKADANFTKSETTPDTVATVATAIEQPAREFKDVLFALSDVSYGQNKVIGMI
ncbi:hypothetical protein BELL_0641g00080 [Botrytis elliptica]|uniref:Uncharacterized protein n=1 Tax=Botrytis elliptica TaxID=278938 RepID=A0A4Z1JCK5_9HELO|nr:hypothetical protein BELL_0641g00080 [Botrytis elliptica]